MEIRAYPETSNASPNYRFVGRSFNLLSHSSDDERGFSQVPILDLDRMKNNNPWKPFKFGSDPAGVIAPEIFVETLYRDPTFRTTENISASYMLDSLRVSMDGVYKEVKIGLKYSKNQSENMKSHVFRTSVLYPRASVHFEVDSVSDYSYFLSRRFVSHLSKMSAADLVDKYGTHLVTSYELGPFCTLTVVANSSVLTAEQTANLTAAYVGEATISADLYNRVENNWSSINVIYKQGGSDYMPSKLNEALHLYTQSKVAPIDFNEWKAKLRKDDLSFISMHTDKGNLVSIPEIILDPYLKTKYTSGILHKIWKESAITYLLCSPDNLEPIKLGGDFVSVFLNEFASVQEDGVYYGVGLRDLAKKVLGDKSKRYGNAWEFHLSNNGLWLVKYKGTEKFLCSDLKMRTAKEDVDGKRYLFFNPIPPSKSYHPTSTGMRLMKKNNK